MSCAVEAGCFTFKWEIENFDIFLRVEDGKLTSAAWKTDTTEGSAVWWCLCAYHSDSFIGFRLLCLNETWNPDRWESSAIFSCGEILPTYPKFTYFKSVNFCISKEDIFGNKMHSNIPQNTLTLDCKMWRNSMKNGGFCIHSVVKKVDFRWCIEDLLFYSPNSRLYSRNKIIEKDNMRINMALDSQRENDQYCICALALPIIDGCFSFVNCKVVCNVPMKATTLFLSKEYNDLRTECRKRWKVVEKSGVIPNASCKLNLQLDSVVAHHNNCQYQITHPTSSQFVKAGSISEEVYGPLNEDLLHLYRESILSDVTINTEGKSFSAHRSILAARSPVFLAMFEKDEMSEGLTGVVNIDDVDSETVNRMLIFLYGGSLEGVQWKKASALYYAADKYDILPLKQRCADILKAGLSSDNVCEALVLADNHSDEQLMKYVVDFIYDHQEVVSSPKWEELEDSKPRLVAKITKELFLKRGEK